VRGRQAILEDVRSAGEAIADLERERTRLYEERLTLFLEARDLDPPVTHRELAEYAGVGELAVGAQLRKAMARCSLSTTSLSH
jgi:hypothetical protein